jgi:non-ribosomal peptide synthetase component E (peptide arylation enzyme)
MVQKAGGQTIVGALTMWELISRRADLDPGATMLIDERDRMLTFGEFRDRAERVAAGLQALGVHEGTPFSWQLPTRIDTVVLSAARCAPDPDHPPVPRS